MIREFFNRVRSLWNAPPACDNDEVTKKKRMAVSSLLMFRTMARQDALFDEYSPAFLTDADVDQFIALYSEQPHPEWVPEMLGFLASQRDFPAGSEVSLAGFMCELIASNPECASSWKAIVKKGSRVSRKMFENACALDRAKILSCATPSPALNDLCWAHFTLVEAQTTSRS